MTQQDATSYDYALNQLLLTVTTEVAQLDGIADGTVQTVLGTIPTVPDHDPAADFVQMFDPHAFTTPAGAGTPNDFVGQLAAFDDSFLQTIGLAGPLDQFVDVFTGGMALRHLDALGQRRPVQPVDRCRSLLRPRTSDQVHWHRRGTAQIPRQFAVNS